MPAADGVCVVTGGSGFVGRRLVEMLASSGRQVVSFDRDPMPSDFTVPDASLVKCIVGDITRFEDVVAACKRAACVWHVAAAVGPYLPHAVYNKVNYDGTLHVIEACRLHGVPKIIMSSSPSTRFQWGVDIDGMSEHELPTLPQATYMAAYAESKALGELALRAANSPPKLMTVAVAPHQVYGPRDNLFLPPVLSAAASGRLRKFGSGRNRVSFTYVDNYCHGLMLAEAALHPGRTALGGFYIVTDAQTHPSEEYGLFWQVLDDACVALGHAPFYEARRGVPIWLMTLIAHAADALGWLLGRSFRLNPFAVRAASMHRWFRTDAAQRDLGYKPIVPFDEGWRRTVAWFAQHGARQTCEAQAT